MIVVLTMMTPCQTFRYLAAVGDSMFKQKKKRFFSLLQLSQYKFLFCSYHPHASMPKDSEMLLLDQGLTVEYAADNGRGREGWG